LHRRHNPKATEARNIRRPQVLAVFDPEAAVARPVRPSHAVVDIEKGGIGTVADGVDGDLQAR